MTSAFEPKRLAQSGRYGEALRALAALGKTSPPAEAAVLRAELLERTGQIDAARHLAEQLLKSRRLTLGEQSTCHIVLARAEMLNRAFDPAAAHLQRAIEDAERAGDMERCFWAQYRLLELVSEQAGPDATMPLIAQLRVTAVKAGVPAIMAALHLVVAQAEAKRGLTEPAIRHLDICASILRDCDHPWLHGYLHQLQCGVSMVRADFNEALDHAHRAVKFAEISGAGISIAIAHGNLAHLLFLLGRFDEAVEHQQLALAQIPGGSDFFLGALDTYAGILLAQGRVTDSILIVERIDQMTSKTDRPASYVQRHGTLTRIRISIRVGNLKEALHYADVAIKTADASGDVLAFHIGTVARAEILLRSKRINESLASVARIAVTASDRQPDLYAGVQMVLACILKNTGRSVLANHSFARAQRFYLTLQHAIGLTSSNDLWKDTTGPASADREPVDNGSAIDPLSVIDTLAATAAVLSYHDRLSLVASECIDLARKSGQFPSIGATIRRTDGSIRTYGDASASTNKTPLLRVETSQGTLDLNLSGDRSAERLSVIQSLSALLKAVGRLESARFDQAARATLWPEIDPPETGDHSIVSGHMREVMNFARRIAKTNVTVLILGESGTGKEIVARAIHEASHNASKPFIPFNCTTVPRDLLESQLFGHRRGAFTGADRDYAGLIRSARDGTLFLDEIGELGLDLQPKLLRFLESGEIAPLGEPGPTQVKVRIVAATNTNLEELVRAGKFREDLFYRLNVVRLNVKPLRERRDEIPGFIAAFVARAADEFKKGTLTVSEETMDRLLLYRWPGNVRQLQNEIRRMVALAEPNSTLTPEMISGEILDALPIFRRPGVSDHELSVSLQSKLLPTLAQVECEMIQAALKQSGGKLSAAAKALGISRKGLYLKRQRYRL